MTEAQYSEFVHEKMKDGKDVQESLTPFKANLIHIGLGISGEAGELVDAIKKHAIYGKDLDTWNILEELGDIEFFLQELRTLIGVTRKEVLEHNVVKLNKRYPTKYSDKDAIERKDKA